MPTNQQRREAAKRKLERQLARRVERQRRRRTIGVIVTVAAVIVVVGGVYVLVTSGHGNSTAAANPSASQSAAPTTTTAPGVPTTGPCKYTTTPSQPAPSGKNVGVPADPNPTPKTGTVAVTLHTSQGDIPITLNRAEAPCTVQSFLHLVQSKFYDNTPCHRLTTYSTPQPLKVLQCGDPTGQGTGGPGYTIPDEKPKTLKAAPSTTPVPAGQEAPAIYPAGSLAMANTGQPNSGGSQFFLVYADSYLPPDYTVFGTFDATGMATLNKIAAGGLTPSTDSSGQSSPDDGKPKLPVTITSAVTG